MGGGHRQGMTVAFAAEHTPIERRSSAGPSGDRTYAELNANANRLVRALRRRGSGRGERRGAAVPNRAEFAGVGGVHAGGPPPDHVQLAPRREEGGYIVDDCEAKAFVAAARCARRGLAGHGPRRRRGSRSVATSTASSATTTCSAPRTRHRSTTRRSAPRCSTRRARPGRSKGVRRPSNAKANVAGIAAYGYREGNVHLCTGPMYHAAPLSISMFIPLQARRAARA